MSPYFFCNFMSIPTGSQIVLHVFMIQKFFGVISVGESSQQPFNSFQPLTFIQSNILSVDKQVYVVIDGTKKKTAQFISQFSKVTSNLQTALISKRFELPGWDWTQMKDFLKPFLNLTNFSYLSLTKLQLSLFIGERRLMSQVVDTKYWR